MPSLQLHRVAFVLYALAMKLNKNRELATAIGLAGNISELAKISKLPSRTLYHQVRREGALGAKEAKIVARIYGLDSDRLQSTVF